MRQYEEQLKLLNTNHVEEPLIVAMANVENSRNDDLQKLYLNETLPVCLPMSISLQVH